ncbi:serine-rich adhesin for platelets-like [Watersipora subatra]|uniref:serine-rich adhesin for platelets-like n=1 Tax=Watersipora subatra TaxID=2589382 RepID=UPI00355BB495
MAYFYQSVDREATKAFIYDDLKVLGIKIPKLDKISKVSAILTSFERDEQKCASGGRAVFGVPLALMDSVEDVNIGYIPKFLVEIRQFLSKHLDREGLFRKSGSISRQRDLAQCIEDGGGFMDDAQVYDVTSIVKQFFRAMPEPLIPHILQDAFIQAVQLGSDDSKIYSLALLCLLLPSQHLSVFRYTLEILSDVSSNAKVNKMNAHNLAVCLTPNIFQTKEHSKHVSLQTEAVRLCIENVINIGAVPPSIEEKVVMLRSLEANQIENDSLEASSSAPSLRKKRRSGSLQGIVGSIRRSVEKIKSKASRRSASVPDDLNLLKSLEDHGCRQVLTDSHDSAIDMSSATPQIMQKSLSGDTAGFSLQKRKAILNQSSFLGTPLSKLRLQSRSSDNVFESSNQNSILSNQTTSSMNSSSYDDSRLANARSRKKSWTGIRSPFSKRRRSLSAGPDLSPKRSRSSSRTKKLIRRLSGGKRKTPDMVGQRLAFSNEEDVASVRCRMPSAPTSLSFSSSLSGETETATMSNEEFLFNLNSDLANSDTLSLFSSHMDTEVHSLSRNRSQRESSQARATLRRRAKSADNKVLRRGRPNHPAAGLVQKKRAIIIRHNCSGSPSTEASAENGVVISSPLDTTELLHPGAAYNEKKSLAAEEAGQSAVARQHKLTLSPETPFKDQDDFDTRLEKVAQIHSDLFSKPPVPRQQLSRRAHRSATFSHKSSDNRHIGASLSEQTKKRFSDADVRLPKASSQTSVSSSDCGAGLCKRGGAAVSVGKEASVSSLTSTDSGISEMEVQPTSRVTREKSGIEHRVVIGGNEKPGIPLVSDDSTGNLKPCSLTVRGAQLQSVTHATSLSNLQEASKVKQSKQIFDMAMSDIHSEKHSCEESDREMCVNGPVPRTSTRVSRKPPRQAPVRIPTVFAKNDPRAMRYKKAADAVRRRSQQEGKVEVEEKVLQTDIDVIPYEHVNREAGPAGSHPTNLTFKLPYSPPLHNARVLPRLSHFGEDSPSSKATPRIPISTDIVRGAPASPHRKVLTSAVTSDRLPLRDHSPNIERQPVTPKIKSAMLPLDRIKSVNRQNASLSASRKSPRSRLVSQHRITPYTTTPNKPPRARVASTGIARGTAL